MFLFSSLLPRHAGLWLGVCAALAVGRAADAPVMLSRVVVTTDPSEQPLMLQADPRAAIQPMPAQDGAEALRSVPGFSVIRKAGTDGDPVLRGMAGSRIGILLDGENILGGCGNRMDPPTAYVFPSAYDRITILKGPQSVLHGPGNSAGVVLFERTRPHYATPDAKVETSLTAGSFGRNDQFLETSAGAPLGFVRLAGTRTASDDYRDGDDRLVPSRYLRWSVHAAAGWTPSAETLLQVSAAASDGEAVYGDRAMDGVRFDRRNAGLRFERERVSPLVASVEANVFVNVVDHVMDNFSLRRFTPAAMMPGRTVSNPDRRTFGGRVALKLTPDAETRATLGIDHQGNRHRIRNTGDQLADPFERKSRARDASFDVTGLFVEASRELATKHRLIAGLRADLWEARDERAGISVGRMGALPNPTAHQRRDPTLVSGFGRYERSLGSGTTAYAGLGRTERFPDYWELFSKESRTTLSAFRTRPERTTQADVGFTHRRGAFAASVALFASRIEDFILIESGVSKPAAMGSTRMATIARNVDAATRGGEASLTYTIAEHWKIDASLAVVHGENRTDERPLAQQPPLEGRIGVSYATPRWSVGTLARFAAAQDRFARNQGNIVGQDLGPTSGFAVFALNAGWRPHPRTKLTAGVDNLLDKAYAEHLSRGGSVVAGFPPPTLRINEPGRTFWIRLELEL